MLKSCEKPGMREDILAFLQIDEKTGLSNQFILCEQNELKQVCISWTRDMHAPKVCTNVHTTVACTAQLSHEKNIVIKERKSGSHGRSVGLTSGPGGGKGASQLFA